MNGTISPEESVTESERHERNLLFYPLLGIFSLTLLSGLFLAVYYIPTFTQAFSSVERLNEEIPFGWFLRRIHGTGATLFLMLMIASLLVTLYTGEYKSNPRSSWIIGVLLLFMGVMANLTGFVLPLSQSAFWGTVNVLSDFASIPWVGNFVARLLRGGKELGGTALIRFYSVHIGIAVLMGFLFFRAYEKRVVEKTTRWGLLFFVFVLGFTLTVTTFLPDWVSDPLKEVANPMANPEHVIPPWYFLFFEEALKFFTGAYPFWSAIALILCLSLLFLLPFVDRNSERKLLLRPMILSLGSASIVILIYFSLLGAANAFYGERVILPAGPLSANVIRGAQVFAQKNCAYCHQVFGREGRREGPDMTVVNQRQRSPDWIRRYILNARLSQPGTTMPRYEIPLEDLEALSAYLLALDSKRGGLRAVDRKELLDFGLYLYTPSGSPPFDFPAKGAESGSGLTLSGAKGGQGEESR
jgi:quinol-cytochrome oxidoreductase complex cytochrome b subunit